MERLLIALVLAAVAVAVALWLQRRRPGPVDTGGGWSVPSHLERADFDRPDAPWLVAVFTSATCGTCAAVTARAEVLDGPEVAVVEVEAARDRALHDRYRIDAVPLVLVAGSDGAVQRSFLGPVTATDLWGAVAALRDPGAVPPGCDAGNNAPT